MSNDDFDSRYFDDEREATPRSVGGGFADSGADVPLDLPEAGATATPNPQSAFAQPSGGGADGVAARLFGWPPPMPHREDESAPNTAATAPGRRAGRLNDYRATPAQGATASPADGAGTPVLGNIAPGRAEVNGRHVPRGEAPPGGDGLRAGQPRTGQQPFYPPVPSPGYAAVAGAQGYPPLRRPDAYSLEQPPADERTRGVHRPPEEPNAASVGDLRAQIRESHVAPAYKPVPKMGWRKRVYQSTRINVGLSSQERRWNDLARRLKVNLRGNYVIAVFGEKGGVTKTTTTVCLGMALKQYRDEKIVAIDANPASGNLHRRILEPSTLSWRGFNHDEGLRHYSDFRQYMGKDPETGLDVLASDRGDTMLTGADLAETWKRLQVQYPLALVDCGNQLRDDIARAILDELPVDAIVVPSTTRLDGALGAADTLNWLMEHGYPHLVRQAVVVVSNVNRIKANAEVRGLHEDFSKAVRAVFEVPFDQHLSAATAIEFWRMQPDTRKAYIEAAAALVDGFAGAADRKATSRRVDRGERR